ncbi:MAG TPA: hypothetical protein VIV60_28665 [Polyangiaceae bacterium]
MKPRTTKMIIHSKTGISKWFSVGWLTVPAVCIGWGCSGTADNTDTEGIVGRGGTRSGSGGARSSGSGGAQSSGSGGGSSVAGAGTAGNANGGASADSANIGGKSTSGGTRSSGGSATSGIVGGATNRTAGGNSTASAGTPASASGGASAGAANVGGRSTSGGTRSSGGSATGGIVGGATSRATGGSVNAGAGTTSTATGGVSTGGTNAAGSASGGSTNSNTSCSAAQVGPGGDFKGYRMFPADHPINTPIDTFPVHARSAQWLSNCSPDKPYLQLDLSMPYNIVAANTPQVTATDLTYNSKPYPNPWPFPADAVIEGGDPTTSGDHHCLAFSVGDCKLYEVYNIRWGANKQSFTGVSGTVWDTTINDVGNGSGSDAAGLPITPLLLRYDEVIGAGEIRHALRFTCQASQQAHIAPARASASSSAGSGVPADPHDPTFPPMGMRVRLKSSYDPTAHGYPAPIVTILKAVQKYGIILADNGGKPTPMFMSGSSDAQLANVLADPAYLIKNITSAELEVVDSGTVEGDYW